MKNYHLRKWLSIILSTAMIMSMTTTPAFGLPTGQKEASQETGQETTLQEAGPEETAQEAAGQEETSNELNLTEGSYAEGEALVVYHENPVSAASEGEEAAGSAGFTNLGFSIDKTWDLSLNSEEVVADAGYDAAEEAAGSADTKDHDSNAEDVKIALVNGNGMSTRDMIKKLEDLDNVEIAGPNYYYELCDEASDDPDTASASESAGAEQSDTSNESKEAGQTVTSNESEEAGQTQTSNESEESDRSNTSDDSEEANKSTGLSANETEELSANKTEEAGEAAETAAGEEAAGSVSADTIYNLIKDATEDDFYEQYDNQVLLDGAKADPLYRFHGYSYASVNGINLNKAIEKEKTTNNTNNVVAVLDTGLDYTNPDLAPNTWTDTEGIMGYGKGIHGYNCITGKADPMPAKGELHGVHVAGIIGAKTGNGVGVAGIAGTGHTKLMGLKIANSKGLYSKAAIEGYAFMIEAKRKGVNIVAANNSWAITGGVSSYDPVLDYVVTQAGRAGILSFFGAANNNTEFSKEHTNTNKENPYVVMVAATNADNTLAGYSNYSEYYVDVAAPGSRMLSTIPNSDTEHYRLKMTLSGNPVSANTFYSIVSGEDWKNKTSENTVTYYKTVSETYDIVSVNDLSANGVTVTKGSKGEPQFTFDLSDYPNTGSLPALKFTCRIENPFYGKENLNPADYSFLTDVEYVFGEGSGDLHLHTTTTTKLQDEDGNYLSSSNPYIYSRVDYDQEGPAVFSNLATSSKYLYLKIIIEMSTYAGYIDGSVSKDTKPTIRINGFSIGRATNPTEDTESEFLPFGYQTGTSMATPAATGMAAELAYLYNITDPLELRGRVVGGTVPLADKNYVHTDPLLAGRTITHNYRDMIASGGRMTFDTLLQSSENDYNANIWSLDIVNGDTVSINGYALKDAKLEVDGLSVNTLQTEDRFITFKAGENLMDGKKHRFIVTDNVSNRTYKTEMLVPKVSGGLEVSLNRVSDIPVSADVAADDAILGTGYNKGLYYADGKGEYLYVKNTVSQGKWNELKAPGNPFRDSGVNLSNGRTNIRYYYTNGGIYAAYMDAAASGYETVKNTVYSNYYDIKNNCWTGYKAIIPDEILSSLSYGDEQRMTAVTYGGNFYLSNLMVANGAFKTLLACSDPGTNDFECHILDRLVWEFIPYGGKLYAATLDGSAINIREFDTENLTISDSSYFSIGDSSLVECFKNYSALAGGGLITGGMITDNGANLAYLDIVNKTCHNLGYAGMGTGKNLIFNSMTVYNDPDPQVYVNAVPEDADKEAGIYALPDSIFNNAGISKNRLSNMVYVAPSVWIDCDNASGSSVDITLTDAYDSNNKSTATASATGAILNKCLEVYRGDKVIATSSSNGLCFKEYDLPDSSLIPNKENTLSYTTNPFEFYADGSEYITNSEVYLGLVRARYSDSANDDDDDSSESITRHKVTFVYNSNVYATKYVKTGGLLTLPNDPDVTDYIFKGWYKDGCPWDSATPVTEDMTLTAYYVATEADCSDASLIGSGLNSNVNTTGDYVYLVKGQKFTLGKDNKGRWATTDSTYVKVANKTGKVTARKATTARDSEAYVTVKNTASENESYNIIVYEPVISAKKATIAVGDSYDLSVKDVNGTDIDSSVPITWISSKPNIASVQNGKVYAKAKGNTKISAYINGKAYNCAITVKDSYTYSSAQLNECKDISIIMTPFTSITLKKSSQLNFDPKNVSENGWKCDTEGVISISSKKKITAIGTGTATLTGTDTKTKVTRNITVTVKALPVEKAAYMNAGKKKTLKYNKVKNNKAKWTVTGDGSVSLNGTAGKIKANNYGTSKVTCSYNGVKFNTTVYVEDTKLDTTDTRLTQPKETKLNYNLSLSVNQPYKLELLNTYQKVLFKSSSASKVFVDENGIVYPVKTGKAKITAKVNGKKININVTVK